MRQRTVFTSILSFLLPALLLTGCQTNTFTHKQFHQRVARIHTVGLVPKVHTAVLNRYFGNDRAPAPFPDEGRIKTELTGAAIAHLEQHGFVVKEHPQLDSANGHSDDLFQLAISSPTQAGQEDAKMLAASMDVDGLIVLNADAFKSTPHRERITMAQNTLAVFVFIASIPAGQPTDVHEPLQGVGVQIALIDGGTGEVLWRTWLIGDNFDSNKPVKTVEDLFARYPKPKR